MDESEPEPILEKQRFLLPEGCKDLHDVIAKTDGMNSDLAKKIEATFQWRKLREKLLAKLPLPQGSGKFPYGFPEMVRLPDPVTVVDLAETIHIPLLHLLFTLQMCGIHTALSKPLNFSTARILCALYGVEAIRAE